MRMLLAATALAATLATPAVAQDSSADSWTGFYAGIRAGWDFQPGDNNETINFDNNLDGASGDTVRTAAGANAFSPGFCGGAARGPTPASGCKKDDDSVNISAHAGFDYDLGNHIVVGAVGEFGLGGAEDYVSAFSTTPAFYTMTRRVREYANGRARAGYAFGNGANTLVYGTGGVAWGRVTNRFRSSNVANARQSNGNQDAWGYVAGGGIEQRVDKHLSVGLLYLFTSLKDNDARIRLSQGTAPANNPFLLVNAAGTDFSRSNSRFVTHNISLTASYRF